MLGGAGSPANKQTMFGSLQLAADIRSDRDEVAPRVLSYMPPIVQPRHQPGSPAAVRGDAAAERRSRGSSAAPCRPEPIPRRCSRRSLSCWISCAAIWRACRRWFPPAKKTEAGRPRDRDPATGVEHPHDARSERTPVRPARSRRRRLLHAIRHGCEHELLVWRPRADSKLSGVDYYLPNDPTNHPHQALGQAQLSLIRAAFACDLVRTSTFMWSSGTNWVVFPGTFNGATIKGNLQSTPHHPPSHSDPSGDTMTRDWLNQINLFYSQQTATALQAFDSTTDIDGNTLARQHHRGLRHRGGARLGPQPAGRAAARLRRARTPGSRAGRS